MVMLVELSIIIVYIAICIAIGAYFIKRVKGSITEFYVAGRNIGWLVNGIAMQAALSSAASFMGFCAVGYSFGLPFIMSLGAGCVCGSVVALTLIASPLRRAKHFTLSEFIGTRYQSFACRATAAIITAILFFVYLIPQLKGAGLITEYLTGIPFAYGVVINSLVFLIYVSLGGMWAITWTDVLQGAMLMFTWLAVAAVGIVAVGGIGPMMELATKNFPMTFLMNPKMSVWSYFGMFLAGYLGMQAFPHLHMRIFTSKSISIARKTLFVFALTNLIVYVYGYIGPVAVGHIIAHGLKEPDMVTLVLCTKLFPSALAGFMIAGIIAAIMSSADAYILNMSASLAYDIYPRLRKGTSEKSQVNLAIALMWVLGIPMMLSAIIFVPPLLGILAAIVVHLFGATFVFPLLLGLWWKRANKYGAMAGMLGGFFAMVYFNSIAPLHGLVVPMMSPVVIAFPISGVLTILVSLATPKPSEEAVKFVESLHKRGE